MAKKLKISVSQTQTIREAFDDFLLQKKALGLADKTIETYSHHFGIISKYLNSSAPIAGLFKHPLDEMNESPISVSIAAKLCYNGRRYFILAEGVAHHV